MALAVNTYSEAPMIAVLTGLGGLVLGSLLTLGALIAVPVILYIVIAKAALK